MFMRILDADKVCLHPKTRFLTDVSHDHFQDSEPLKKMYLMYFLINY